MKTPARLRLAVLIALLLTPWMATAGLPVQFQDAAGRSIVIDRKPSKVVCLVPSITEILFRIGAGDTVAGVTYHDTYPPAAATKAVVGGFFSPSLEHIGTLEPDLIFTADIHDTVVAAYAGRAVPRLIQLKLDTFDDLYESIRLLGQIFGRASDAESLVGDIQADLKHTSAKIDPIPPSKRLRVMRLMGRQRIMTPGDDSFQNEIIRRAGGIPPTFKKTGKIVPVTLAEWQAFNPQMIYGCGGDRKAVVAMLDRPGWRDVAAVKNGRIRYFPCDLTCRLSTRSGYFVSCLASRLYTDQFADLPPVRADGPDAVRPVPLVLDYVDAAKIVESTVNDYPHKTLLIHLNTPMAVASTLEGFRERIRHVGNSYSPFQVWGLNHHLGLDASRAQLLQTIGMDAADTSLLFTGANMDNLSVQRQEFKAMRVYALVTAGVRSNAVRMAEDIGSYYEPGTINMIILANMRLSPRAMNRAMISATEAKTAALQDLDIRSAYTPIPNPATGTGTDNIIVVQGAGHPIDNTGGHSKMGELIAKAVYAGVQEAVFKQNGIVTRRHLVQRLKERKISLFGLVGDCSCGIDKRQLTDELEQLMMEPAYTGFIQAALAISDDYERGLISDISGFAAWCDQTAAAIAGQPITEKQAFGYAQPLPMVLKMAFDALLNGVAGRLRPAEAIE